MKKNISLLNNFKSQSNQLHQKDLGLILKPSLKDNPFSRVYYNGDSGDNSVFGKIDEENTMLGFGGDDVLIGGNLDDVIDGGDGNDVLAGLDGKDDMKGGKG
ncbi:MAG: hypothetical protein K1X44_08010, partial [Alphaproteobacteria bacterium]|nr:hypothetical protein [Alphaproteobacteria bacterium]